jgi:signal peptidase II
MPTCVLRRKPPACRGADLVPIFTKVLRARSITLTGFVTFAFDQISKAWAAAALDTGSIEVLWKLRFHLTTNTGFAFSTGKGLGPLLALLAACVVVLLWRMRTKFSSGLGTFALGLVLGGACGNLADRLFRVPRWGRGAVVDFIDFRFWPVFNLADGAIVAGVVMLTASMWVEQRRDQHNA